VYYFTSQNYEEGIPCKIVRANENLEAEHQIVINEYIEDACFLESGFAFYVTREKDEWDSDRHLVCLNSDLDTVWETTLQENKEHYSLMNVLSDAILLFAERHDCLTDVILKVGVDGGIVRYEENHLGFLLNTERLRVLFGVDSKGSATAIYYLNDYMVIDEKHQRFNERIVVTKFDDSGRIIFMESYPLEISPIKLYLSYSSSSEKVFFVTMTDNACYSLFEIDLSTKQRKELISEDTIYGHAEKEGIVADIRFAYDLPPFILDNDIIITAWTSFRRLDEKENSRICLSCESNTLLQFDVEGTLEDIAYKDGMLYLITAFAGRRTGRSFVYFIELDINST